MSTNLTVGSSELSTGEVSSVAPVTGLERAKSIDALRGLAVLGILVMNMPYFGMPMGYANNPSLPEGSSIFNVPSWFINLLFFEGKMRGLFSILFSGFGCVIMTSRADQRNASGESADIYYRRTIWLMVIGLLHAYFIWDGDILFWYGALGLLLYPFRRLSAISLIFIGLMLAAVQIPQGFYNEYQVQRMKTEAETADAIALTGQPLTEAQEAARTAWQARLKRRKPPTEKEIEKQISEYQSDYLSIFGRRARQLLSTHANSLYQVGLPDVLGFMILGMGLYKLGILTASRSYRFYFILGVIGYGVGLTSTAYLGKLIMDSNFDRSVHMIFYHMTYNADRIMVALGHIALMMLLCKSGSLSWLTSRLMSVGQMALTNYLMQSVLCTTLFYGYGFGVYGKLQYYQLVYVVLGIWLLQLIYSPLWLKYFRFGPVEWLWRSLTYLRWQPFRKKTGMNTVTINAL